MHVHLCLHSGTNLTKFSDKVSSFPAYVPYWELTRNDKFCQGRGLDYLKLLLVITTDQDI